MSADKSIATIWSKIIFLWSIQNNPDFSSAFHTYRVEWRPDGFQFFINDTLVGSVVPPAGGFWELGGFQGNNIWKDGTPMAPFDQSVNLTNRTVVYYYYYYITNMFSFILSLIWQSVEIFFLMDAPTPITRNHGPCGTPSKWENSGKARTVGFLLGMLLRKIIRCKLIGSVSILFKSSLTQIWHDDLLRYTIQT